MKPGIDPRILWASALLGNSSRFIRTNAASLIECHSNLVSVEVAGASAKFVPVPGSIDPDAVGFIGQLIKLLRDIDAWIGAPLELGPDWLDDIIAQRNGWEGGQL